MVATSLYLFLRLLLGAVMLWSGVGKLIHVRRFQQGIEDYQLLPARKFQRLSLPAVLSFGIPLAEVSVGLGLLTGGWLIGDAIVALGLLVAFSSALSVNLIRGRHDLSCHCGGALGDHRISWWLVGRNALLAIAFSALLSMPADLFVLSPFSRQPSSPPLSLWINTALPIAMLAGLALVALVLLGSLRTLFPVTSILEQ